MAAPRQWDELDDPSTLFQLEIGEVLERLEDGDPLAHLLPKPGSTVGTGPRVPTS